jgi:hypothetical protein
VKKGLLTIFDKEVAFTIIRASQAHRVASAVVQIFMSRLSYLFAIPFTIYGCLAIAASFQPGVVQGKDFIQPYLMSRAILERINPYIPLPDLTWRYLRIEQSNPLPHATPYTPIAGLLCAPLGLLEYHTAALIWGALEIACLASCILMVGRAWNLGLERRVILVLALLMAWPPVIEEIRWGQFGSILLLLATCALIALRQDRDLRAGLALGLMLALKLFAWPILLYLAMRRRWRVVATAFVTTLATNLLAAIVLGWDVIADYYLRIGPEVTAFHRRNPLNISAWTWAPDSISVLLPALTLIGGLWLATRMEPEAAFCLLLIVSLLVSPVLWLHYATIALLPFAVVAARLRSAGWPRWEMAAMIAAIIVLALWQSPIGAFAPGLVMRPVPLVGLLMLAWLTWLTAANGERVSRLRTLARSAS